MAKQHVFVSFDYENDSRYKYLLQAWDANPEFDFEFSDYSATKINSENVGVVKQVLSRKINLATHTLVIVGEESNVRHSDYCEIGYENWQNYEIAKSVEHGNKIIGVKINRSNESPEELIGIGASWALSFTRDAILTALNKA